MRAFRALIAGLLVTCAALLAAIAMRPPAIVVTSPAERAVTFVDYICTSCGSGNGPSSWELANVLDLAPSERVVAMDGRSVVAATALDVLDQRRASHYHGETIDLAIDGLAGKRRVILRLR